MHRLGGLWGAVVLLFASAAQADRPDVELDRDPTPAITRPGGSQTAEQAAPLPPRPYVPRQVPFLVFANGAWHSGHDADHAPFGADLLFVIGRRWLVGGGLAAAVAPIQDRSHYHEGWLRPALRVELHGAPARWIDPWLGFSGGPRIVYLNWFEGSKRHRELSVDLRAEAGLDFRLGTGEVRWILGPSAYYGSEQERALVARVGIGFL